MMRIPVLRSALLTLAACASLAGCGADDDSVVDDTIDVGELAAAPQAAPFNAPGSYRHRVTIDGQVRELIVYVPEKARGARPAPVVFMLHGTSGDGLKFYRISGWREKADAEGLIAVFPTALVHCFHEDENGDGDFDDADELKVTTKWAAGKLGDPTRMPLCTPDELAMLPPDRRALADHPLADDVAFVTAMVDRLPLRYAADESRVYASGFSNGASMTSRLALEMSDRFAAVAAASGSLNVEPAPAARPIPVVLSYGEVDEKFTAALGIGALPLDETVLEIPGVQGVVNDFLTVTSLAPDHTYAQLSLSGATTADFVYATSVAGASNQLELMVIEGLGHQYPNGKNHPVVMADELWARFSRYSLH